MEDDITIEDLDRVVKAFQSCHTERADTTYHHKYSGKEGKGIVVEIINSELAQDKVCRLFLFHSKKEIDEFAEMCDFASEMEIEYDLDDPIAKPRFIHDGKRVTIEDKRKYMSPEEKEKRIRKFREVSDRVDGTNIKRTKQFDPNFLYSKSARIADLMADLHALYIDSGYDDDPLSQAELDEFVLEVGQVFSEESELSRPCKIIPKTNIDKCIGFHALIEKNRILYECYKKKIESRKKNFDGEISYEEFEEEIHQIDTEAKEKVKQIEERKEKMKILEEKMNEKIDIFGGIIGIPDGVERASRIYSLPFFSEEREKMLEELVNEIERKNKEEQEKYDRERQEKYEKSVDGKSDRVFKSLREQFDTNLTEKQKRALITYQTSLFILFTKITAIEDYKSKSDEEILKILKADETLQKMDTSPFSRLLDYMERHKDKKDDYFSEILKGVIPKGCKQIGFKNDGNKPTMVKLIHNIREQIDTLESIPEDAIILPEDAILYRGTQVGNGEIDTEMPARGMLMSTTLSAGNAQRFNASNVLFKMHVEKGIPILYSPYIITADEWGDLIFDKRSEATERRVNEIIIRTKDIESTKHLDTRTCKLYASFPDERQQTVRQDVRVKLVERPERKIIECEVKTREKYQIRNGQKQADEDSIDER